MTVQGFANKFADQLDQQADTYSSQADLEAPGNMTRSQLLKEMSSVLRVIGNEARRAASIHNS